jgi:hypothetical protein
MDKNEKKMHEMMDKMGRMALIMNCRAIAEMVKEEEDEQALIALAGTMIGAASLLLGPCEGKQLLEKISGAIDTVIGKIIDQQKAEQEKETAGEKDEAKESEPDPAPEPAPEPSSIPEFKGMSQEEIAKSMEKIFGM